MGLKYIEDVIKTMTDFFTVKYNFFKSYILSMLLNQNNILNLIIFVFSCITMYNNIFLHKEKINVSRLGHLRFSYLFLLNNHFSENIECKKKPQYEPLLLRLSNVHSMQSTYFSRLHTQEC